MLIIWKTSIIFRLPQGLGGNWWRQTLHFSFSRTYLPQTMIYMEKEEKYICETCIGIWFYVSCTHKLFYLLNVTCSSNRPKLYLEREREAAIGKLTVVIVMFFLTIKKNQCHMFLKCKTFQSREEKQNCFATLFLEARFPFPC